MLCVDSKPDDGGRFDAGEDKGDDKDESDGTKSRIRAHCKFRNISIWKPHTLLSFTQ